MEKQHELFQDFVNSFEKSQLKNKSEKTRSPTELFKIENKVIELTGLGKINNSLALKLNKTSSKTSKTN